MPWRDLVSQPRVCDLLGRSICNGRIHHAYLFAGEESETIPAAHGMARALNCEKENGDFCGSCPSCFDIAAERHPDVVILRPESKSRQILIPQLRELERMVFLKASRARHKVAIIQGADRMNESAQNAFLKTLEEPPPRTVFLLLSEEPQQLKETVISRCLRVPFRPAPLREKTAREQRLEQCLEEFAAAGRPVPPVFRALGMAARLLELFREAREEKMEEMKALEDPAGVDDLEASQREKLEEQVEAQAQAEYLRERSRLLRFMLEWFHARRGSVSAAGTVESLARRLARNVNEPLAVEIAMIELARGG